MTKTLQPMTLILLEVQGNREVAILQEFLCDLFFSNTDPTFPFNCLFRCSWLVKRLLCPFRFSPLFESKAVLLKKCHTTYQIWFIVNKNKNKRSSQFCSFMNNYCLFSKLIPLVSSGFLRNCVPTDMLSLSGIFHLCLSLLSLGVSQQPALCPKSVSSIPLLLVDLSSVSLSLILSLFLSSSLTLSWPVSLSHSCSFSPHTRPPAFPLWWVHRCLVF